MTEKQYPKLPEPEQATDEWSVGGVIVEYFTGDQMRAYVDADRAMRATQAAPASQDAEDAARYRWLAAHCRSTAEHWGGRWSIIVEGPAPKSHNSEDDFDAAIDAAIDAARAAKEGDQHG